MGIQREVAVSLAILMIIGCGICSGDSLLDISTLSLPPPPTNVSQALEVFDNATNKKDFMQAQLALQWINSNYLDVLRSPQLGQLSLGCLMEILSQPCFVDEIEVFRAVRRIVEAPGSPHRSKAAMLYSTVRLLSIDLDKLESEVIPSGVWPYSTLIDVILQIARGSIPKEFSRQTLGNVSITRFIRGNVIGAEYGAKMVTNRADYSLSPACKGSNPLIDTIRRINSSDEECWFETGPNDLPTIYLGGEFILHRINTRTLSTRRCPNLRLEISEDNHVYTHVGTISSATGLDSITFEPRKAAYIRYRSDTCKDRNGYEVTGLRLNAIAAELTKNN